MKGAAKKAKLLKLIDIDKIQIKKDRYFPDAYTIDLPLDSTPDHVWQDIFEREWKLSRHLWDRKLFVLGSKLRLLTPPSDIQEKLEWVKEVIELTNKGIDEYNKDLEARAAQIDEQLGKRALKEERANIEMIKDTLRKKFASI